MLSRKALLGLVCCSAAVTLLALSPHREKRPSLLGNQFKLVFHDCHGLREGDLVKVAGVDEGRVVDIDFAPRESWPQLNPPNETRPVVLVTVSVDRSVSLTEGTGYKVVSTLRGHTFINILPPPHWQCHQ